MGIEDDKFIPLHVANVAVVDRAAVAFQNDGDRTYWYLGGTADIFEHAFWATMYGPAGDEPSDFGMMEWPDDGYDDPDFDYDALDAGIGDDRRHVLEGLED